MGFLVPGMVTAQDVRARIRGSVVDNSRAVVVGAMVSLRNDETGVQATQATNEAGQYIFDFINPGTYTLTVELAGFKKFVQRNILAQSRGDLTVDAVMEVGQISEQVTVEAAPVSVQFNSSTMSLTLDTQMTNNLPIIHRNPFLLVNLNPAVVLRSTTEQSPFHHWAASQFEVGGNTNTRNDILLDGAPSMTSQKSSYTPSMDAVSEVNLQQNAVDAEFGHSAGGILSLNMKSGTNEFHGTAYYLGRNPAINAVADATNRRPNLTRNNIWGGTLGHPVLKNKLFNFVSYEAWRSQEPRNINMTVPTELERQGDFSQTINALGGLRQIFDPFSTTVTGSTISRLPFPGNRIPANRIDPTAARMLGSIWLPNGPGDNATRVNNFRTGFSERIRYWNFSDRADWNISDRWKVFGRYSQFNTYVTQDEYAPGSKAQQLTGSARHSISVVGDTVYTINPSTVFNIRGSYNAIVDSFDAEAAKISESDLAALWPSQYYRPYLDQLPDIYFPGLTVRAQSTSNFGRAGYWYQEPKTFNMQSKISKNAGRHYIKVGGEFRRQMVEAARPRFMNFDIRADHTADTFERPDLRQRGDAWASFLVGALDPNSNIASIPIQRPAVNFWGVFLHDDFKITPRLTLNLGLRWEYFGAMVDPEDRLSRFLDRSNPIPEFQGANAPALPASVRAIRGDAPQYNGAWVFTDSQNRNSWNPPANLFLPRIGLAYRVNNKTSLRVGWARYAVPSHLTDQLNILGSVPYPGFDAQTDGLPLLAGVPQSRLSDPFPGGLVPIRGKGFGRYTNLGQSSTWYNQNFRNGINERFNLSIQRELPWRIVADITAFVNVGYDHPYPAGFNLNAIDPRYDFQYGASLTQAVPNPFFNVLPLEKMPGQLRTQQNVQARQLLRPSPQYGDMFEILRPGQQNHYRALQLMFQRPFANGFNFVVGYNYNQERNTEWYDEVDRFTENLTWQPGRNPRHRMTVGSIYELPIGKGRRLLGNAPRIVDYIAGGWSLSGIFQYNSGEFLRFGGLQVTGDPRLENPSQSRWFNTSAFRVLQPFTRRTNPLQFSGLTGPGFNNLDLTLAKNYAITERVSFELRMEAYNATNSFMSANPVLDVNAPNFGSVVNQRAGFFGRQFQYSGRLRW